MKRGLLRLREWLLADAWRLALILLALAYCAIFMHLASELHAGMRTHRSDLGQIDQAVWNSSQGRWLEQTDNGFVSTRLTDHVEPILVLISPFFWLWDDVRALLLLQCLAAAAGVLPLYGLALRRLESYLLPHERSLVWRREPVQQLARPLAFTLGVAYLFAPQLQSALLTEFHAAPLAVPLILWAFWAVDARRWGQFAAAALLTALVKEEMALLAAGLGAWAMWRAWWDGARVRSARPRGERHAHVPPPPAHNSNGGFFAGLLLLLLGLGWFVVATFVVVPAYALPLYGSAESTYFARYGALGDSAADIFRSLVAQPQVVLQIAAEPPRIAYLWGLLAAFGFFSLLAPEILLLSLPLLLANLLSAYPAQYYGEFHYSAPLVAYFGAAAAYGLGRLWRFLAGHTEGSSAAFQHLPAASSGAMAAAALLQNRRTALRPLLTWVLVVWLLAWSGGNYLLHGRGPLGGRYDPTPVTDHHRLLNRFVVQVPADAPLTATAGVHPHVSHRRYVYQFPLGLDPEQTPVLAEWALLDVTTNTDMAPGDLKANVDKMLVADWGVVDAADGFLLLRRGAPAKAIPDAFYTFTRVAQGPGSPAGGSELQLVALGVDDWSRWRQTKIVAEWKVDEPFGTDAGAPFLEVTSPAGEVLATLATAAPPALAWYPPQAWRAGETVRATTLPLTLPGVFAVRASGDEESEPAIFAREPDGDLHRVPPPPAGALGEVLTPYLGALQTTGPVQARLPDGSTLHLRGWLPLELAAGQPLDILLQWQLPADAAEWPPTLAVFVHLRRGAEVIAQADGQPQWFGYPSRAAADPEADSLLLNDWRQITPETSCTAVIPCAVLVGVYDPLTGARLPLLDANGAALGDEFKLGSVVIGPPRVPDQACALAGGCP